jgi:hypothetical protein
MRLLIALAALAASASPLPEAKVRAARVSGCVADVNGDGHEDYLALESGRLVAHLAPSWSPVVIEQATDFQSCLGAELHGKRGVIITHYHSQDRFYEFADGFPYRDLYSIYTPSRQAGLLLHDVDGDGHKDLFMGNYWVRNPGSGGMAWRLFAINNYFEKEESASARLALAPNGSLYWGASGGEPRLVRLTPAGDVRQLWHAEPLAEPPSGIRALLCFDDTLFVAHEAGVAIYESAGRRQSPTQALGLLEHEGVVYAVSDNDAVEIYRRR